MNRKLIAAAILAALSTSAHATTTAIWTLQPESSQTWAPDPYYGAPSSNPQDILHGIPVDFKGFKHPGGSLETLGAGHLVFRWRIDYSEPVEVETVTMIGFGDFSSSSQLRVLNSQKQVIQSVLLQGANINSTNSMSFVAGRARGTTFYVDVFDVSWDGTYISDLKIISNALSGQCTK